MSPPDPVPHSDDGPADRGAKVFADWLAAREGGGAPPFDELAARHPELADELRSHERRWRAFQPLLRELAAGSDDAAPDVPVDPLEVAARGEGALAALLARLRHHADAAERYEVLGEIGRGGVGVVLAVRDRELGRTVAMKLLRSQWDAPGERPTRVGQRALARFLDEAQVTAQLQHPGIPAVHELGFDGRGRVYFTLARVEGQRLDELFAGVPREEGAPSRQQTRALQAVLQAAQAVAYAHSRGIVHRDLKPANVMVGELGRVLVMDWGLARAVGGGEGDVALVRHAAEDDASPLATLEGQTVGTVCYMPPEQALGRLAEVGPRSDVYALGAVLYELLAGRPPYLVPGREEAASAMLERVRAGPPEPLERLAPRAPAELRAICERAMAPRPADRYAGTRELCDDLQAFLDGRTVRAWRGGPWIELRNWVRRNRALAAALAVALVGLLVGAAASGAAYVRVARAQEEVLRLAGLEELRRLGEEATLLWPADPERVPAYERWLADSGALVGRLPALRAQLAELRGRAREPTAAERAQDAARHPRAEDLHIARVRLALEGDGPSLTELVAELEAAAPREWRFSDPTDRWLHEQLAELVAGIEALVDPETGPVDGVSPEHGVGVRRRLELARTLRARTVEGAAAARWDVARAAVAANPAYAGLELEPRVGLLPLGCDPESGLLELAHLASGEPAVREAATGRLALEEATGVVLVLVPGGTVTLGSVRTEGEPHFDASAGVFQGPRHAVELDPFLLAKHELTQAQWRRATGANPSFYGEGLHGPGTDPRHPVESVTWHEASRVLAWLGLALPTEAQWEHACRAGTRTIWYAGDRIEDLAGRANLADAGTRERDFFGPSWTHEPALVDDYSYHGPVDAFPPNPWGLHGMIGNVTEWCRDRIGPYTAATEPGTGLRLLLDSRSRVHRGGNFFVTGAKSTSAFRGFSRPDERHASRGVRAAAPW